MPTKKRGTIFINYRREDSNWNALALYNELQKYFDKAQIFKDFNAIQPGDDFVESISSALQRCDVLLVLIGSKWIDMKDDTGRRRLEDPDDFVRLEISKALSRGVKVIPVMLDEAKMPRSEQLPENLQPLTRRQLVEIDPTRFEDDVRKLAEAIKRVLRECGYEEEDGQRQHGHQHQQQRYTELPKQQQPYQQPHQQQQHFGNLTPPKKPDSNLVWGIITTVICCFPFGIASIVSSSKVDDLYRNGKYTEAQAAADRAKKYAIWSFIASAIFWTLYFAMGGAGLLNDSSYNY